MIDKLKEQIESASSLSASEILSTVDQIITLLNAGDIRVAEKVNGTWLVNSWIKEAILLGFSHRQSEKRDLDGFDKFGLLNFDYEAPMYRKVPGTIIREGSYIGPNTVIMPSFINIGVYVGEKTMIDINSAIGSCAQIGSNCHISAMTCIGGVLEPTSAMPVIIEDNCFIGAHSAILEGVIVGENSVIASGVIISASTKIIDRKTGKIYLGEIPKNSVVVPGSYQTSGNLNISCAVIIKMVDHRTRQKSSINEILREQ
ncbi:MAG: 2,3,4,5-tetrahydropyridine-2,6-dicarboxylate N-succinyltransferase [Holosporales bacterium]|nr:2,3,4,5-tetrahydropyridine-2,6-dicarboxylate N-succinyltransferase [Holosporales bacterium]